MNHYGHFEHLHECSVTRRSPAPFAESSVVTELVATESGLALVFFFLDMLNKAELFVPVFVSTFSLVVGYLSMSSVSQG